MTSPVTMLRQDCRGSAVIETAIALPVLLMMAFAFIDLTQAFTFRMSLQQYAQSAADFVVASNSTVPTDAQIKTEVANLSRLPTSAITITRFIDCNGNRQATGATGCPAVDDLKVNYMTITIKSQFKPALNIKQFANYMPARDVTRSATVRLPQ